MGGCVLRTAKLSVSHPGSRPVVLLSCGSFNPPTIMHLRMFDVGADALALAGVDVWGGYISPVADAYGKPGLAPAAHRVAMCEAAAAAHPIVECDPWEAQQPAYTRTMGVLRRLQAELDAWWERGGRPQAWQDPAPAGVQADRVSSGEGPSPPRVKLLCGADVLLSFLIPGVWEEPEALLREFGVVCVERGGVPASPSTGGAATGQAQGSALQAALDEEGGLLYRCRHHIHLVAEPVANSISSTLVRREWAAGRAIRYLVPDPVLAYLQAAQPRLYGAT